MEATISPQFLPPKSIIAQFDAPNSPPQNPNHEVGFPIPAPPPRLLFWKRLTWTDATNHRLYINDRFRPGLMAELTAAERRRVETDFLGVPARMEELIGDNARYQLRLKRTTAGEMVLQKQWKDLVMRNGLVDGDAVAGYGYRNRLGQFCLIFSVIRGE